VAFKALYWDKDLDRPLSEPLSKYSWRQPFRRDYARLIHSTAFRRLTEKTQLFPGNESDFFRNRLTHSLEVAQIAKSIAQKFNHEHEYFKQNKINEDLMEVAGLAHDLGHPPFGHIGERALDDSLRSHGGFEGNAQTLRILSKLEKKVKDLASDEVGYDESNDQRYGLNLTYRSLASILKYDRPIPANRSPESKLAKGYYDSETSLVRKIKEHVTGYKDFTDPFKTIECSIMDIADDIAYSTFDLEDAFKANFLHPMNLLAVKASVLSNVHKKVILNDEFSGLTEDDVLRILQTCIRPYLKKEHFPELKDANLEDDSWLAVTTGLFYRSASRLNYDGYVRSQFSSAMVTEFIDGISVDLNKEFPALSKIKVDREVKAKIECIKHFVYCSITLSSRLRIPEYRGYEIVNSIFTILDQSDRNPGSDLLPDDFLDIYRKSADLAHQKRTICDFVAGMTDRYVIEFYGRLKSENPETIFKPI